MGLIFLSATTIFVLYQLKFNEKKISTSVDRKFEEKRGEFDENLNKSIIDKFEEMTESYEIGLRQIEAGVCGTLGITLFLVDFSSFHY